jgi:hypothetical protein
MVSSELQKYTDSMLEAINAIKKSWNSQKEPLKKEINSSEGCR